MKVKSESEVAQSCPTLSDPMDCSLPGSSIHGIFQARVLEWGAIAFSEWNSSSHKSVLVSCSNECMKSRERDIITGGYERVIGEGNDTPLHYSGLGNPMDGGAWWATVHGCKESDMTK